MSTATIVKIKKNPIIAGWFTERHMSPYRMVQVLNANLGTNIAPQTAYAAVRNGSLRTTKGSTGKLQVTRTEAVRWCTAYVVARAGWTD